LIGNQVHTMSSGPSEKGPGHWYNVLLQEFLFSHPKFSKHRSRSNLLIWTQKKTTSIYFCPKITKFSGRNF
jgi:hypothetical protein